MICLICKIEKNPPFPNQAWYGALLGITLAAKANLCGRHYRYLLDAQNIPWVGTYPKSCLDASMGAS